MELVVLRRLDEHQVEIINRETLPSDAIATGRILPTGFPEYIYGSPDLVEAFKVVVSRKLA